MSPTNEPFGPPPRPRRQADLHQAILWARLTLALVVAALVGVIALPDRGGPSPAAVRRGQTTAALEALSDFRGAIQAYRIDHGVWPGWEPADDAGPRAACAEVFILQLTHPAAAPAQRQGGARADAGTGEETGEEAAEPSLGPYLPGGLPANPINGLASVRVLQRDEPWPLTADDRTGWIYDPRSGLLKLNSQGRLEGSDVRYFER